MVAHVGHSRGVHAAEIDIRHFIGGQLHRGIGRGVIAAVGDELDVDLRILLVYQVCQVAGVAEGHHGGHGDGFVLPVTAIGLRPGLASAAGQQGYGTAHCQQQAQDALFLHRSLLFSTATTHKKAVGVSVGYLIPRILCSVAARQRCCILFITYNRRIEQLFFPVKCKKSGK